MANGKRLGWLRKRLSRTTFEPYSYGFDTFLTQATNPYNDNTTFREIYEGEPRIRGIIDTQANAIYGDYDFEFLRMKPQKNEIEAKETYLDIIRDSDVRFNQKIRSIAVKLLLDNLCYVEIDSTAKNFYVLNKKNCEIIWERDNITIAGINWYKYEHNSKESLNEGINVATFISIENLVIFSYHDPDTDLWQSAPMRSLVESANILFHSRDYNNEIFKSGDELKAVITSCIADLISFSYSMSLLNPPI